MMRKPDYATVLESKIQYHRSRAYWLRFLMGGRFRLAYLQMRYYRLMGTMFDKHLTNFQTMNDANRDRARKDEMLQHPYDYRKTEISDLPKSYQVEVCWDLKKAIHTAQNPERLSFLLQRFQYELLSRR